MPSERDVTEQLKIVKYPAGYFDKDLMDTLRSSLAEVTAQGYGDCRLCPFRAQGSLSEILEQMGQHGEISHANR